MEPRYDLMRSLLTDLPEQVRERTLDVLVPALVPPEPGRHDDRGTDGADDHGTHAAADHPAADHPAADHPAADHPAADHPAADHAAADHAAADVTADVDPDAHPDHEPDPVRADVKVARPRQSSPPSRDPRRVAGGRRSG